MEQEQMAAACTLLTRNNEWHYANAILAKSLQNKVHDQNLIRRLGIGYLQTKNYEAARICFIELAHLGEKFEALSMLAKTYELMNETELAKETYLDAILHPTLNCDNLFEAYKSLGNLFLRDKCIEQAEDFYHKAYALNPSSEQLLTNLGTLEMQRSELSAAINRYRQSLQNNLTYAPAWVGLALAYQQFGDHDLAWASLLKSIDCDPENTTALLLIAQWAVKQESEWRAIQLLMNFFDRGHFDNQLSQAFVELCVRTDQFFLARIEVERSLLWEPQSPELLRLDKALKDHGY